MVRNFVFFGRSGTERPQKMLVHDSLDPLELVELHDFNDASFQNYEACTYVRSTSLVIAKSRLAPMKLPTIPRLPFLGNLLLCRLMLSVDDALSKVLQISKKCFRMDSQVTLAWTSSQRKEFKTFVENRVQEIRRNRV